MSKRVVITGLGVVSPNAIGVEDFEIALKNMKSGISFHQELADKKFSCQIAGTPKIKQQHLDQYFTALEQKGLLASGLIYGGIAGQEAWQNAGLSFNKKPDFDAGIIYGTGVLGVDKLREAFHKIDQNQVRRLGSQSVIQTMASGISAFLGQKIGCGNQVTTNSSACATGTEALMMGYERIKTGQAKRMLVGSTSDSGPYIWGGFEALRILPHQYNNKPEEASRPFSEEASGFVPSSGAGALVLEDFESAQARNAPIYAEIIGGHINSGGQRQGGSMTAPNSKAVIKCIETAIISAEITSTEIDTINAHLTATKMDATEIENWTLALDRKADDFPFINSLKGMVGHGLAACGSLELVASVLQISKSFIFGNRNAKPIHSDILNLINKEKIPLETIDYQPQVLAKASFGFGDVNACVILKKFKP
ncbi:beta-ketoacyl-[acyl-carrier-protein] synthase family protein [Flavobacteriaceae bacterium 14752]|uniref:beta-ketoacyl-[acyl-carrier-protein] synthase family protein n=1 Tax=Mesohalobacter salilacus TaxID=2491711 RepID=UPI000F632922|nr:beta-ketoacyl-[acyl-carrier-protein] synthase family protein [Flavobacteriaceae bacterium 14752]